MISDLLIVSPLPLEMVALTNHLIDLLNDLLDRYYKYWQNMLAKNLNFSAN